MEDRDREGERQPLLQNEESPSDNVLEIVIENENTEEKDAENVPNEEDTDENLPVFQDSPTVEKGDDLEIEGEDSTTAHPPTRDVSQVEIFEDSEIPKSPRSIYCFGMYFWRTIILVSLCTSVSILVVFTLLFVWFSFVGVKLSPTQAVFFVGDTTDHVHVNATAQIRPWFIFTRVATFSWILEREVVRNSTETMVIYREVGLKSVRFPIKASECMVNFSCKLSVEVTSFWSFLGFFSYHSEAIPISFLILKKEAVILTDDDVKWCNARSISLIDSKKVEIGSILVYKHCPWVYGEVIGSTTTSSGDQDVYQVTNSSLESIIHQATIHGYTGFVKGWKLSPSPLHFAEGLTLIPSWSFQPRVYFQIMKEPHSEHLTSVWVEFEGELMFDLEMVARVEAHFGPELKKEVVPLTTLERIIFDLGPIPVVLTPYFEVNAVLAATFTDSVHASFLGKVESEAKFGVEWYKSDPHNLHRRGDDFKIETGFKAGNIGFSCSGKVNFALQPEIGVIIGPWDLGIFPRTALRLSAGPNVDYFVQTQRAKSKMNCYCEHDWKTEITSCPTAITITGDVTGAWGFQWLGFSPHVDIKLKEFQIWENCISSSIPDKPRFCAGCSLDSEYCTLDSQCCSPPTKEWDLLGYCCPHSKVCCSPRRWDDAQEPLCCENEAETCCHDLLYAPEVEGQKCCNVENEFCCTSPKEEVAFCACCRKNLEVCCFDRNSYCCPNAFHQCCSGACCDPIGQFCCSYDEYSSGVCCSNPDDICCGERTYDPETKEWYSMSWCCDGTRYRCGSQKTEQCISVGTSEL